MGAGKTERTRKALTVGLLMMTVLSVTVSVFIVFAGGPLVSIFCLAPESIAIGADFFRSLAPFYLIHGLGFAIRGYLEGHGDLIFSGVLGILSMGVRLGGSYLLKDIFGIMTVAYAEGFSWIFTLAVYLLRYRYFTKKKEK